LSDATHCRASGVCRKSSRTHERSTKGAEQEIHVATPDGEMTVFTVHPDGEGSYPVAVLYMDGVGYRTCSQSGET
jgi:hypothetical protein